MTAHMILSHTDTLTAHADTLTRTRPWGFTMIARLYELLLTDYLQSLLCQIADQ
jgi:hypothetical protein